MAGVFIDEIPYHVLTPDVPGYVRDLNAWAEQPQRWHCPEPATALVDYRGYGYAKGMELVATTCEEHTVIDGFWLASGQILAQQRDGVWAPEPPTG